MEELRILVCPRVGVEGLDVTPEWGQTACVECGCDVHLSPEGKRISREKQAMPVCSECSFKLTAGAGEITDIIPIGDWSDDDGQKVLAEVKDLYQRAVARGADPSGMGSFLKDVESIGQAKVDGMDNFDSLKLTAAAAGKAMPPDGQWGAICVIENWEGDTFPPIPLGEMMLVVPHADIARKILPAMIHAADGKHAYFGMQSYLLLTEAMGEMRESLKDEPGSREVLVIFDVTADGVQRVSYAEINRDGISAPTLGAWNELPPDAASDGLFLDTIIPTLKLIRTLRGESVET